MFFEIDVLKISQYSQLSTFVGVSFFSYQKKTPTQVLSCEYCEIFENNFFYRTPPMAASEGLHHGHFTRKFPNSVKLYQQLERPDRKLGKRGNLGKLGFFSEIFISEFLILAKGQNRRLGNKKTRNNISEISEISEVSKFSICHFFIFFLIFFFFF